MNLKNRWWHRLLFVAFVVAFVAVVWGVIADTLNSAQLPKYTKVGILSDRVDAEIRLIGNLVQPGERIGVYEGNVYGNSYNQNGGWLLRQEYYCSKNISSKVEEISAKTEINYYKGNLDLVSLSDFKNYLAQNSALCVQVLGLDNPERYGNVKKALSWGLEADDMAVWAPSTVKSVFAVLQSVFFIALGFLVILILYYKVFLYIVFGKNAKL